MLWASVMPYHSVYLSAVNVAACHRGLTVTHKQSPEIAELVFFAIGCLDFYHPDNYSLPRLFTTWGTIMAKNNKKNMLYVPKVFFTAESHG